MPSAPHPTGTRTISRLDHLAKLTGFARDTSQGSATLDLDAAKAGQLLPGDDHYRAYVGPPGRFDFMSATQFALLFTMGLRETDKVLDIGCGSLRLGRLLIPFLLKGGYHGDDPNAWLIEDGIERELGRDAVRIKQPVFSLGEDFDFERLGNRFDFIMAQSIATHCGPDYLARMLAGARRVLKEDGVFLFTFKIHELDDL
ncbi:MAG: class I SAM-dependent methyltransferase, partial [Pseudomonadota bacterium]|nr:class I SAM-dependent methyltransferase [Pseudomonadota bacterium]